MLAILVALLLTASVAAPQAPPPPAPRMPHFDWGACPFECCTYRAWTATRRTTALLSRETTAPIAFSLRPGERVRAVTGVVVTARPGIIRIREAISVGAEGDPVFLQPGDLVYMLHNQGAGFGLFWFKGKLFSDQFWSDELGVINGTTAFEVLSLPTVTWWVKLKNSKGVIGWSLHPEDFDGADACG